MTTNDLRVTVNGTEHALTVPARLSLADALRERLHLTGTHLGCEHGVCGACTVLVDGDPVRSCITLAAACDGREVVTVEGLSGPVADAVRAASRTAEPSPTSSARTAASPAPTSAASTGFAARAR